MAVLTDALCSSRCKIHQSYSLTAALTIATALQGERLYQVKMIGTFDRKGKAWCFFWFVAPLCWSPSSINKHMRLYVYIRCFCAVWRTTSWGNKISKPYEMLLIFEIFRNFVIQCQTMLGSLIDWLAAYLRVRVCTPELSHLKVLSIWLKNDSFWQASDFPLTEIPRHPGSLLTTHPTASISQMMKCNLISSSYWDIFVGVNYIKRFRPVAMILLLLWGPIFDVVSE